MCRGSSTVSANGFASVLGTGRYGARVSEATQARRDAEAQRQARLNSPAIFWLRKTGEKKIQTIKIIRSITNWGLKESKDFVDHPPGRINMTWQQAEQLAEQFAELNDGAQVEITDHDTLPADIATAELRSSEAVELTLTGTLTSNLQLIKIIRSVTGWGLRESKQFVDTITPTHPGKLIIAGNLADHMQQQLTNSGINYSSRELGPMAQVQTTRSQVRLLARGNQIQMLKAYRSATGHSLQQARSWLENAVHPVLVLPSAQARDFARDLEASNGQVALSPIPD
jgi:ribosomal protein L7/L12